jgi:hypothetical protein
MLYRSTGLEIKLKRRVAKKSKEAGNDTGSTGSAQVIKGWKHLLVVCYPIVRVGGLRLRQRDRKT